MTRFTTLLLATAIAALACVPVAGAASIAYVAGDGNVHLVSPDGARDRALTTNATPEDKYRSPSQIDDGRVVALRRADGSTSFAFFLRREDGQVLSSWLLPKSGVGGFAPYTGAQASPQGGMIAYDYRHFDCASNPCEGNQRVGFVSGPGQTNPCLVNCHVGYVAPRWLPDSPYAVMVSQSFDGVYVQKAGGAYPVGWYSYGAGITVEGVDVRGGFVVTSVGAGDTEYMVLDKLNGAPPALPQTRCSVSMPDNARPRLSPDGSMIAWQAPEGVMVSPTPTQTGGAEALCQLAPKLLAAGGSQPDWGIADVPAAPVAEEQPKGAAPSAKLTKVDVPKLAKALDDGFRVGVRCAGPCRVAATATVTKATAKRFGLGRSKTRVAAGKASLAKAGSAQVRLRFTATAQAKLAGAGSVPVTVTLLVTDPGGGQRKLSKVLRLKG